MFKNIVLYCKDTYEELVHKTTWPTRKELLHSAIVVLIASVIIAAVVFAMDKVFYNLMQLIYQIKFWPMAELEMSWYVLRAVSGKEAKVKEYIDAEIKKWSPRRPCRTGAYSDWKGGSDPQWQKSH